MSGSRIRRRRNRSRKKTGGTWLLDIVSCLCRALLCSRDVKEEEEVDLTMPRDGEDGEGKARDNLYLMQR